MLIAIFKSDYMRKKISLRNLIIFNKDENNNMEKKMNINYLKKNGILNFTSLVRHLDCELDESATFILVTNPKEASRSPNHTPSFSFCSALDGGPCQVYSFLVLVEPPSIELKQQIDPAAMGVLIQPSSFSLCMASLSTLSSKDLNTFSFLL
jgi:hypothetical protein